MAIASDTASVDQQIEQLCSDLDAMPVDDVRVEWPEKPEVLG